MKEVKVSVFKKKLKKQLNFVSKSKKALVVTRKKPKKDVVIISLEEYNSLKNKAKSASKNKSKRESNEATEKIEKELLQETEIAQENDEVN